MSILIKLPELLLCSLWCLVFKIIVSAFRAVLVKCFFTGCIYYKIFAAKVAIGGARKYDHATPFIKELKWLTINDKYIFEKCTTVYKVIHGLYPDWYIKFPTVSERAASITRQENNLHIPRAKTDSGARATTICGPKFWNNLPHYTKGSGSLHSFRSSLLNVFLKDS